MSNELRAIVAKILQVEDSLDDREEAARAQLEAQGYRLVTGGQTGVYGSDGKAPWQVKDYRTGEILAQGRGRPADIDAAWHEDWYDTSNIAELGDEDDLMVDGVPDELITAIREHVTRPAVEPMYREWVRD